MLLSLLAFQSVYKPSLQHIQNLLRFLPCRMYFVDLDLIKSVDALMTYSTCFIAEHETRYVQIKKNVKYHSNSLS